MGQAWSVCAEPEYPGRKQPRIYTQLPYALIPQKPDVVPFNDRPHRVYILGKRMQYLYTYGDRPAMFSIDDLRQTYIELKKDYPDLEFVGSFIDDSSDESKQKWGPFDVPDFINNHGQLDSKGWGDLVATSRLMLGIGWPPTSPSPYHAFARGVPFLNPVSRAPCPSDHRSSLPLVVDSMTPPPSLGGSTSRSSTTLNRQYTLSNSTT